MPLKLNDKKAIVAEVAHVAGNSLSAVVAEYTGLTVAEMTKLRVEARNSGVYLRVVRNTLARLAFQGTNFECLQDSMVGPLVLAFSSKEPGSAARLVKNFAKENPKLVVRALAVEGQLLAATDLDAIASLSTRDEALSILLAVMKAPVTRFVQTLAAPHTKLVRTLDAYRDKKQAEQV